VDLDDIIEYTIMNHDISIECDSADDNNVDGNAMDDALLAYMAGRSSTPAGELRQVLAANTKSPNKNKVGTNANCRSMEVNQHQVQSKLMIPLTTCMKVKQLRLMVVSMLRTWLNFSIGLTNTILLQWNMHL
jgi:hypothetical protein